MYSLNSYMCFLFFLRCFVMIFLKKHYLIVPPHLPSSVNSEAKTGFCSFAGEVSVTLFIVPVFLFLPLVIVTLISKFFSLGLVFKLCCLQVYQLTLLISLSVWFYIVTAPCSDIQSWVPCYNPGSPLSTAYNHML